MLRSLASAHRLRILHLLGTQPFEVNEIARELGLNQAAASQHLSAMRSVGLVEAVRDGRSVSYRLTDPQILAACGLMRAVLVRRLSKLGDLAAAAHEPAATIAAGASAMGRPVNILVQFWALDAFRADRIDLDHGLAFDAARPGLNTAPKGSLPWAETFRQAKELGEVQIRACSASMDYLGITQS